jgi:hypothetical protein
MDNERPPYRHNEKISRQDEPQCGAEYNETHCELCGGMDDAA